MSDRTGRVVHSGWYHWFNEDCGVYCVLVTDEEAVQWIWGRQ